jgi:hypothetical protein
MGLDIGDNASQRMALRLLVLRTMSSAWANGQDDLSAAMWAAAALLQANPLMSGTEAAEWVDRLRQR